MVRNPNDVQKEGKGERQPEIDIYRQEDTQRHRDTETQRDTQRLREIQKNTVRHKET